MNDDMQLEAAEITAAVMAVLLTQARSHAGSHAKTGPQPAAVRRTPTGRRQPALTWSQRRGRRGHA